MFPDYLSVSYDYGHSAKAYWRPFQASILYFFFRKKFHHGRLTESWIRALNERVPFWRMRLNGLSIFEQKVWIC